MEHIVMGSPVKLNSSLNLPASEVPPGSNLMLRLPPGVMLLKGPVRQSQHASQIITPSAESATQPSGIVTLPTVVSEAKRKFVFNQARMAETHCNTSSEQVSPGPTAAPKKYILIKRSALKCSTEAEHPVSSAKLQAAHSVVIQKKLLLAQSSMPNSELSVGVGRNASGAPVVHKTLSLTQTESLNSIDNVSKKAAIMPLSTDSPVAQKNLVPVKPALVNTVGEAKHMADGKPKKVTPVQCESTQLSVETKKTNVNLPSSNVLEVQQKFLNIQPAKPPVTGKLEAIENSSSNVDPPSTENSDVHNEAISRQTTATSSASKSLVWTTEPHPQMRFKEILVLHSGASKETGHTELESEKGQKSKSKRGKTIEQPPKSLPCPKYLEDILPKPHRYHIVSYDELSEPERFHAEVRVNIFTKEDAMQWLLDFEELSGTNFRVTKTFKEHSDRLVFKKCYKCHKNTSKKNVTENKRNVGCKAKLSITIKKSNMKSSADLLLTEFPCVIGFHHNHCHSLTNPDALKYRRLLPEVKEKFATMYKAKITPSAALRLHKLDLQKQYGDKYAEVIQDGAKCPNVSWCYNYYYEICGQRVNDGKKKSTRKSITSKIRKPITSKRIIHQTADPSVNFDFPSSSCLVRSDQGEVERSVNSLYKLNYVSKPNVMEENVVSSISTSNAACVEVLLNKKEEVNNGNDQILDHDGSVQEFTDSHEIVNDVETFDEFEDSNACFDQDTSALDEEGDLSVNVTQISNDLAQIFNDLHEKFMDKPETYSSAIQNFVIQYKRMKEGSLETDLVNSLSDFGSKNLGSLSLSHSVTETNVSKGLRDFSDQKRMETSPVGNVFPSSESPKRKVLVLRMDPNKFNQILGKVADQKSKTEILNI